MDVTILATPEPERGLGFSAALALAGLGVGRAAARRVPGRGPGALLQHTLESMGFRSGPRSPSLDPLAGGGDKRRMSEVEVRRVSRMRVHLLCQGP